MIPHDLDIQWLPDFLAPNMQQRLFDTLVQSVPWQQETVNMFGRTINVPRLTAWYGDVGTVYQYSGLTHQPLAWRDELMTLREQIQRAAATQFNSVLLNRYRNGSDSVAWHADDEPELGPCPTIASLSLGVTRRFQFKHKSESGADRRVSLELLPGSLLIMRGSSQHNWLHQIPKTKRKIGERINLTFRHVRPKHSSPHAPSSDTRS